MGSDVEKPEHVHTASAGVNWYKHLGNHLLPSKSEGAHSPRPSGSTTQLHPRAPVYVHQGTHIRVIMEMEAIQGSIRVKANKYTVVYSYITTEKKNQLQ